MAEKQFLVIFRSGDTQPVVAQQVVEEEEGLLFLDSMGKLVALFDRASVEEWHEESRSGPTS